MARLNLADGYRVVSIAELADERRRLSRAQRHYIEEWVHLLAPLRPDLADGEVRLAVHAAIGAIQSMARSLSTLASGISSH